MHWVLRGMRGPEGWADQGRLHKGSRTEALKHGQDFTREEEEDTYG